MMEIIIIIYHYCFRTQLPRDSNDNYWHRIQLNYSYNKWHRHNIIIGIQGDIRITLVFIAR